MSDTSSDRDSLALAWQACRSQEATDFNHAWVGMEPTCQSEKSVKKWIKMSSKPDGGDAYYLDRYLLKKMEKVAKEIEKRYKAHQKRDKSYCLFARVERDDDLDQWHNRRQNSRFHWADENVEPFTVRFGIDPETFEYSIKPVPLVWFYDARFVTFLEEFLWKVPRKCGLSFAIAHGGGQYSLSAKTFLTGSLLADDIASKLNHPELATWIMDWPNPDDRPFRATRERFAAFEKILQQYWEGKFHPQSIGVLTAENAYLDRGFGPACSAHESLMDPQLGPQGTPRDVFQTNFAFGRAVRLQAQNIHPGYWQAAHPDEDGYRPDQIMRYGEGNLNRLQIAGELHVKSGKVVDAEKAPELRAPLELALLTSEASWENRAQMSRTSARDFVEALLLDVHHAQYLQKHPHVPVTSSLLQDQLLVDAEKTLNRYGAADTLARLHAEARKLNFEASHGRMNTDWIEPEALFWAAWKVLPPGEKANLAREAIGCFVERVELAATMDPRPRASDDPMEWHRHRIHPALWEALSDAEPGGTSNDRVGNELKLWQANRKKYLGRRPVFSQADLTPPWEN